MFGLIETMLGKHRLPRLRRMGQYPIFQAHRRFLRSRFLPPDCLYPAAPSKIVCVGRNYSEHAKELGNEVPTEPLIFFKPPSSLISPGEKIVRPRRLSQRVDFEGELTVVIGKKCFAPWTQMTTLALTFWAIPAPMTLLRVICKRKTTSGPALKALIRFAPSGPSLRMKLIPGKGCAWKPGSMVKSGNQKALWPSSFPWTLVLRFISQVMTLLPGDLVLTGTPAGVRSNGGRG